MGWTWREKAIPEASPIPHVEEDIRRGIIYQSPCRRGAIGAEVSVEAKLGGQAMNWPGPGKGQVSISVHVIWDVWVRTEDIWTSDVAVNIVRLPRRRSWELWKKRRAPWKGMTIKGQESAQYRGCYRKDVTQPVRDEATFECVGEYRWHKDPFELEFVLKTGVPKGEHRLPLAIDWKEMRARGTNPPL